MFSSSLNSYRNPANGKGFWFPFHRWRNGDETGCYFFKTANIVRWMALGASLGAPDSLSWLFSVDHKNESQRGYLTGQGLRLGNWAGVQVPKPTFIPFHLVFGGLWTWLSPPLDPPWRCWEPRPAKPLLWSLLELSSWVRSTTSRSSPWVSCSALRSGLSVIREPSSL